MTEFCLHKMQANSPLPPSFTSAASAARTSSDHSDEIIPSPLRSICSPLPVQRRVVASAPSSPIYRRPESYERLLLEKDMEEQRLSSLWSSRTDRPRSPFGRYDSKDTEARRKLVHNRQMLLPYSPLPHTSDAQATYHGMVDAPPSFLPPALPPASPYSLNHAYKTFPLFFGRIVCLVLVLLSYTFCLFTYLPEVRRRVLLSSCW